MYTNVPALGFRIRALISEHASTKEHNKIQNFSKNYKFLENPDGSQLGPGLGPEIEKIRGFAAWNLAGMELTPAHKKIISMLFGMRSNVPALGFRIRVRISEHASTKIKKSEKSSKKIISRKSRFFKKSWFPKKSTFSEKSDFFEKKTQRFRGVKFWRDAIHPRS